MLYEMRIAVYEIGSFNDFQDITSTHLHSITCGIIFGRQGIGVPET